MPSLLILAVVAAMSPAPASACTKDRIARIVAEQSSDPFFIVTRTGRRVHIMGVDFLDPSAWRAGDRLSICGEPGDAKGVVSRITDLKRKETLGAVEDRVATPRP